MVEEDEEELGQGCWVGGRLGGGGELCRGAGRYLESLPVGPNHSDSVLTPGLFLQSPQLPASLFRGWAGGGGREREQMKQEKMRGRRGRYCLA